MSKFKLKRIGYKRITVAKPDDFCKECESEQPGDFLIELEEGTHICLNCLLEQYESSSKPGNDNIQDVSQPALFTKDEFDLIAQWFNAAQDLAHKDFLKKEDYVLAKKIYGLCGRRVSNKMEKLSK